MASTDDLILTIDANVFNYLRSFMEGKGVPESLRIKYIHEFSMLVENSKMAMNDFIEDEYLRCSSSQDTKYWLKERNKLGLNIEVSTGSFPRECILCLRDDYTFNINDRDMMYLKVCNNTTTKNLVTQNHLHFKRSHKSPKRRPMHIYLKRELGILVDSVDECAIRYKNIYGEAIGETAPIT